ncbi:MAG: hypothetical protein ABWY12_20550 [Burkholderiales bacterium]
MSTRKFVSAAGLVAVASALVVFATAAPAAADHTHVKETGSGRCVVLAEGAGEESVVLPTAVFERNPNVDAPQVAGRMHPLHVLVHLGTAGEQQAIYVLGSPAAIAACGTDFVNR